MYGMQARGRTCACVCVCVRARARVMHCVAQTCQTINKMVTLYCHIIATLLLGHFTGKSETKNVYILSLTIDAIGNTLDYCRCEHYTAYFCGWPTGAEWWYKAHSLIEKTYIR